ncbi:hypothetical protein EDD68_101356 [Melghiribacillus thermohalophilus]|uniref:DUF4190 domain-containing protein n=1 Tax=Melghiribacillus thermohalophilus TaxID=1324956 RepID=A0A4R3NDJ4_9BACI|nr:DUF4190 domain-containing protein [Melghiribacillus thermohalophilus]TCT26990.1 hypothetical protein EDD68_101356 [Melghiribacillus thermohalophilus]
MTDYNRDREELDNLDERNLNNRITVGNQYLGTEGIGDEYEPDNRKRDEEFAEEAALYNREVGRAERATEEKETNMRTEEEGGAGWGWTAIFLSFFAFFIMPIILGVAGILVGLTARRRGAEMLGNIAVAAGGIAVVLRLLDFMF